MVYRWIGPSILSLFALCSGVSAQVSGDVNGNGYIESFDAAALVDHLTAVSLLSSGARGRADCNGQVGLDVADLVWILNHLNLPVPELVSVPAGTFEMGDPWAEGGVNERPVHTVTLSAHEIGRFEVTNAEYAAFLNDSYDAGEITIINDWVYGTGNSVDPLFIPYPDGSFDSQIEFSEGTFAVRVRDGLPMDDHPVVQVSWCGAAAYCNWLSRVFGLQEVYTESGMWPSDLSHDGYHLPTEAQWERAGGWDPTHSDPIAGGHWRHGFTSDTIDQTQANFNEGGSANPLGLTDVPYTSPVGHYTGATSHAGCSDMSGNVSEWCNDWYDANHYSASALTDPEGPLSGTERVQRGGGWGQNGWQCRSAIRTSSFPNSWGIAAGFRLARTP